MMVQVMNAVSVPGQFLLGVPGLVGRAERVATLRSLSPSSLVTAVALVLLILVSSLPVVVSLSSAALVLVIVTVASLRRLSASPSLVISRLVSFEV